MKFNILLLLLFQLLISQKFESALGECQIIINNKNRSNILEYQRVIKFETQKLMNEYGPVKQKSYEIIIPKTKKEFFELAKTAPEWGIAIAKSRENKIIIQPSSISNISKKRFKEILIHELNHLYIHRLIKSNSMPSWFIEGIAMKFSNEFSFLDKIEISKSLWKNTLIPLPGLNNFNTKNKHKIKLAYAQAAAALNALEYYYGDKITHQIINLLKKKHNFWDAILQITGDDEIDFQEKYEFYISNYFLWIFLLKAPNMLFVLFPFILILGYFIKRKKNITIMKKWEIEEEKMNLKEENLLD